MRIQCAQYTALIVFLLWAALIGVSTLTVNSSVALPPTPTDPPERFTIAPDLYGRQLRDDLYVFTHEFPWPANALLVVMGDGSLVLVDTPYTPEATEALVGWLRETFGERDLVVINTGFHVDNLGGNQYLIEQGIPVYGSDKTVELLASSGEHTRAYIMLDWLAGPQNRRFYEAYQQIPFVAPDHIFPLDEGLTLTYAGETVEVYFPGPSHTLDNVVVYFPAQRVLFGGCMILAGDTVGNDEDADRDAWPDSVAQLKRFDADIVVPGHGDRLDADLIDHTIRVLKGSA